jgi:hypothetical protein
MNNRNFPDEILEGLCRFTHRYSTTEGEREAAGYLKSRLEQIGLSPEIEPFQCQTTFSSIYAIIYGGLFLAILLYYFTPWPGFLFMLFMAIIFIGEQTTLFSPLSKVVPRGVSQNVIAKIPARESRQGTLVLVAHYDTSKTSLAFAPATVRFLRPLYVVSLFLLASAIVVMILCMIPGMVGIFWLKTYLALPAVYLFYMTLLMFERDLRGRFVNGAADNATGAAVVMELARWLKQTGGIKDQETWILLTGAEEVGMAGMAEFIKNHGKNLDKHKTLIMNFDNLGGGKLCYIKREGMLYKLSSDPRILALADELSREEKFQEIQGRDFNALTLDTLVPHSRGYRVIAFMGLNKHGVPYPWHWFNDILENVDREVMYKAADFAKELIKKNYKIEDDQQVEKGGHDNEGR